MRISKGGLLVVLALLTPLLVELRVVAAWINVELTVAQTALVGLALISVILVYAFWPESDEGDAEAEGNESSGPAVSNSD